MFSALPLYFALREAGKQVRLASLSFSYLGGSDATMIAPALFEVTGAHAHALPYFPEAHLAAWLAETGDGAPIFCFDRRGLAILEEGYRHLIDAHDFDTVVLVDGGTDSLMRGDEAGLGTPAEDAMSLLAVDSLDVPRKLLACLGFGVDRYQGVCHAQYLEAVAELTARGAFLGAFALTPEMDAVRRYVEATEYVQAQTRGRESIVCGSVLSALEGKYGDAHRYERTRATGTTLWINPLMTFYWSFHLGPVAERLLYADWLRGTTEFSEVVTRIEAFRKTIQPRPWEAIPS